MKNSNTASVIKKSKDPEKSKLIRNIFEIDEIEENTGGICVRYNKTIFFQQPQNKNEISKIISNAYGQNSQNIQFNLNISNNYYHSPESNGNINESTFNVSSKNQNNNSNKFNNFSKSKSNSALNTNLNSNLNFNQSHQKEKPSKVPPSKKSNKTHKKNLNLDLDQFMFIPCMNCGNNIALDDIEEHSIVCTKVTEEVMKTESSNYELYSINYKLNKLKEHMISIVEKKVIPPKDFEKEMLCVSTVLLQYINDTLGYEIINLESIKEFKKILLNLETLLITYKASLSTLILIDRTKVLVSEKLKIFKSAYRMQINTKKANERKSGYLKYEDDMKEKLKELNQITQETELEKTKVKNLRKSATPADRPIIDKIQVNDTNDENSLIPEINDLSNNYIDDIKSDVYSNNLCPSNNTSMSNISAYNGTNYKDEIDNTFRRKSEIPSSIKNGESNCIYNAHSEEIKNKQEFYKVVLKVKFEKLHNTHKGQKIPQNFIYSEAKKQNIPKAKWPEFILGELNNPMKYINMTKILKNTKKSRRPTMGIIDEEQ